MIKVFFSILLIALLFLVLDSEEQVSQDDKNTNLVMPTFVQNGGSLIVNAAGKTCLLADDALAYEPYMSPDTGTIAVETQLMSNLQIIRVYEKNEKGCFQVLKTPLSTELWHTLSQSKGFSMDDVIHPSMQFVKWVGTDRMLITLRGEVNGQTLDENISYPYKPSKLSEK